jgi:6-phospho-beta-glucosidase
MLEGLRRLHSFEGARAVILTVLGGSAHSTPVLLESLSSASLASDVTLRLVGRNAARLAAVARAGRLLTGVVAEEYTWERIADALPGSDAVLIQIRPGEYTLREFDESFPLSRDVPGDEGLGPGGLSAAWRGWPVIRPVLALIREKAPRAHAILLTSPGSLLVRLAAREFPGWPLMGVCELPWTTLCELCGSTADASTAQFDYAGVNHIGWLYNVDFAGRDMIEGFASKASRRRFPSRDLVARLNAYPVKYLRLHYDTAEVVREQAAAPGARARNLSAIAVRSFGAFGNGTADEIRIALRARKAEWYSDAVAPLLQALNGRAPAAPLFITIAESHREVRERRYRGEGKRIVEVKPRKSPPDEVTRTLNRFIEYEQMAVEAVLSRSEARLGAALSAHPWVRDQDNADAFACIIVRQGLSLNRIAYV